MSAVRLEACVVGALALVTACGPLDSAGEPVPIELRVRTAALERGSPSEFGVASGWNVHLDEAKVVLGPIYLRSPRREAVSAWQQWLLPRAHAHPGHAATLTEGQVVGELLSATVYDALQTGGQSLGVIPVSAGRVDRLSVMLSQPQGAGMEGTRGHLAYVRGWAVKDEQRVEFACGLDIEQDGDETPENLAERRRIDAIALEGAPTVGHGDALTIELHVARWLARVDFDAIAGAGDPCGQPNTQFLAQWYLGLRRPEAFAAVLERGE